MRKAVAPPTPVMHSLEDILQRLVPARDDSFGHNPFLVANGQHGSRRPISIGVADPEANNNNEIVSTVNYRDVQVNGPRAVVISAGSGVINSNVSSNNGNSSWVDPNETQSSATSIYIIAVVAVIPLAGVVLWIVRVQLHKRRDVI